jgi:ABC-2 type transport system ATP-binding protein
LTQELAIEAKGLIKDFDGVRAVDGVDLAVPAGAIYGVLGPNGAGKTTTLRMLLGIIDPETGERRLLGNPDPLKVANQVGYLPEERGLYPMMPAREAIAFLGALRGLGMAEGRRRADQLLEQHGLGDVARRPIRTLSKGMAQTVQILGTIIHGPRLIVLDEPFSGLDALNQGRLEALIRAQVAAGATVLFSTHVIAHAERLCERIAIIVGGRVRFEGSVDDARGRMRPTVTLVTRRDDGPWREALPADARHDGRSWSFELPTTGIEPLLAKLIAGDAGIEALSIERPGLHDAFVDIVGATVTSAMNQPETEQ